MKVKVQKHNNFNYLYKKFSIKEISKKCNQIICDSRIKKGNKNFNNSVTFFIEYNFCYEDCWNLDTTIAALILPRLYYFKENHNGIPGNFINYNDNFNPTNTKKAYWKWNSILDDIIEAFYRYLFIDSLDINNEKDRAINEKIINNGLKLFAENFTSLWD